MWHPTLHYRPKISLSRGRDREMGWCHGICWSTMSLPSGGIWPYKTVEWVQIQWYLHPGGNSLEAFGTIQNVRFKLVRDRLGGGFPHKQMLWFGRQRVEVGWWCLSQLPLMSHYNFLLLLIPMTLNSADVKVLVPREKCFHKRTLGCFYRISWDC